MRWAWTIVLLAFVVIILGLEAFALMTNRLTFSRYIWEIGEAWPLFIFLCGFVVGGLAVHFWWHWDPKTTKRGA